MSTGVDGASACHHHGMYAPRDIKIFLSRWNLRYTSLSARLLMKPIATISSLLRQPALMLVSLTAIGMDTAYSLLFESIMSRQLYPKSVHVPDLWMVQSIKNKSRKCTVILASDQSRAWRSAYVTNITFVEFSSRDRQNRNFAGIYQHNSRKQSKILTCSCSSRSLP